MQYLPREIQAHIASYAYNPLAEDEDVFYAIQEINPYYSLKELYYRYLGWKEQMDNLLKTADEDNTYINNFAGKEYTIYEDRYNETYKTSITSDEDIHMYELINLTEHDSGNPLNPAIIRHAKDYIHSDNYLRYNNATIFLPRRKYETFDFDILNAIKALEPRFSLQNELRKWQIIHNARRHADPKLLELEHNIISIEYIPKKKRINIDRIVRDSNEYIQSLKDREVSEEEYVNMCLALWKGCYIPEYIVKGSRYPIPYVNYFT